MNAIDVIMMGEKAQSIDEVVEKGADELSGEDYRKYVTERLGRIDDLSRYPESYVRDVTYLYINIERFIDSARKKEFVEKGDKGETIISPLELLVDLKKYLKQDLDLACAKELGEICLEVSAEDLRVFGDAAYGGVIMFFEHMELFFPKYRNEWSVKDSSAIKECMLGLPSRIRVLNPEEREEFFVKVNDELLEKFRRFTYSSNSG
jgi:hypothetical protein